MPSVHTSTNNYNPAIISSNLYGTSPMQQQRCTVKLPQLRGIDVTTEHIESLIDVYRAYEATGQQPQEMDTYCDESAICSIRLRWSMTLSGQLDTYGQKLYLIDAASSDVQKNNAWRAYQSKESFQIFIDNMLIC